MKSAPIGLFSGICLSVSVLLLASCSLFNPGTTRHAAHAKPVQPHNAVTAVSYVEELSLGRLAIASEPADDSLPAHLAGMKAYALQKQKKHKAEKITLVILEYKTGKAAKEQRALAAVDKIKPDYAPLQAVMDKLSGMGVVLYNVHLESLTLSADKSLAPPDEPSAVPASLDDMQLHLLAQSQVLPPSENIASQLSLLRFLTAQHDQDAAYLVSDNVKRTLAAAVQNKSLSDEDAKRFSSDIEQAESDLRQTLPYKF